MGTLASRTVGQSAVEYEETVGSNYCIPIIGYKDILKFAQSSKNIIDIDSNHENKMNIASPVPTSSEIRKVSIPGGFRTRTRDLTTPDMSSRLWPLGYHGHFKVHLNSTAENRSEDVRYFTLNSAELQVKVRGKVISHRSNGRASLVVKVSDSDRLVTSSSPVPPKTRREEERCTLNLSRAQTSTRRWGVVVRRGDDSSGVVLVT
ncbi:hypothetical protein TNCV_3376801 [Trichonephila clavipes]|nr:hypothetical protein TNCV_3376801 [Trichonephila clavipes]